MTRAIPGPHPRPAGQPTAGETVEILLPGSGVATLRLQAGGIVELRWPQGCTITEGAAQRAAAAVEVICAGQRRPMLVDMEATASVTREARSVFGRPGSASRIALLGSSPVDKVIANFILGVSSMPVPTRFFTVESKAVAWLRDGGNEPGP